MKLDKNNNCICDVCKSGDWCMEYLKYRKKLNEKRKEKFEEFEKRMETFAYKCASCRFLKNGKFCEELKVERNRDDEKCERWRYFG